MSCKGVILAGGNGTRLMPLTISTNKHLLRVGKLPMIEYPLRRLIEAGITDIHVVTGGENYQGVVKYLGSGSRWGVKISYSIQDEAGGIAQALGMAESFAGKSKVLVILGDNVFDMDLRKWVNEFESFDDVFSAYLFSVLSRTPERFGVIKWNDSMKTALDIIEKPKKFISNDVVVGIYMYTPDVFQKIKTLKPSERGELEITDVNRLYIKGDHAKIVNVTGNWTDCGTFETLMRAEEIGIGENNAR